MRNMFYFYFYFILFFFCDVRYFFRSSAFVDGQECESPEYELGSGKMFDQIAPKYDIINKVMSLGMDQSWRRALVSSIEFLPEDRVLDLATGTADVAILLGKKMESFSGSGIVLGIDPSANMISFGNKKVEEAGLMQKVKLQLGDAQNLNELETSSFNKVTMSFGIRNVPDKKAVLKEIFRVLVKSPDSRVAIMEFHQPTNGLFAWAARLFIRFVTPSIGWLMSGNFKEYDHLEKSILSFPDPTEWGKFMEECGFEVLESKSVFMNIVYIHIAKPTSENI